MLSLTSIVLIISGIGMLYFYKSKRTLYYISLTIFILAALLLITDYCKKQCLCAVQDQLLPTVADAEDLAGLLVE